MHPLRHTRCTSHTCLVRSCSVCVVPLGWGLDLPLWHQWEISLTSVAEVCAVVLFALLYCRALRSVATIIAVVVVALVVVVVAVVGMLLHRRRCCCFEAVCLQPKLVQPFALLTMCAL